MKFFAKPIILADFLIYARHAIRYPTLRWIATISRNHAAIIIPFRSVGLRRQPE